MITQGEKQAAGEMLLPLVVCFFTVELIKSYSTHNLFLVK
ncbi:hypothetical protein BQ1740_3965 [Bacillus subtilis]|nr:hypothetical protein BQ1740_3965 [Bacillus subtilis]